MVDTVCALATPDGRSALGLIRVSGPEVQTLVASLSGLTLEHRKPALAVLKKKDGTVLDEVVLTFYASPNSYTGEDLLEISAHGNPIILRAILGEIVSRETCRMAAAGEFTRRALVNGKLSIDKVEALDRLIHASSEKAAEMALQSKLNGLGKPVQDLISQLTDLLADMQSQLDFSDAEVGAMAVEGFFPRFFAISSILESWLNTFRRYRQLFERTVVVFVGEPNAGKSSLFNGLLGIDKAIVHERPGTTRDYIEHPFDYNGFPFLFVDTAGIRSTEDPVEALGIKRSKEAMERADIILWISDRYQEPYAELTEEFSSKAWLKIGSKADLREGPANAEWLDVSVRTGLGINRIMESLHCSFDEASTVLMSDRQASRVAGALAALKEAESLLKSGEYLDYTTAKVLEASHFMKEIVDEIPNDDVLKSIFSRFCIGK